MAEFKSYDPDVESMGISILSIVEAMGPFKERGYEILKKHGLENIKPDGWYGSQLWLDALKEIAENIGPVTLKLVGFRLSDKSPMPPGVKTLAEAMKAVNIRFLLGHRKNGKPMYNVENDSVVEGIGRFTCEQVDERQFRIVSNTPYPCVFDHGAGEAIVKRFKPKDAFRVKVEHDDTKECRRKGGDSCTYNVFW